MTTLCPERYAVYHASDPWAMVQPSADRWLVNNSLQYRHVADVQAPLERVFALTNHFEEHHWASHPEIVWHATDSPVRSTSVGDVILSRETGQAWLVMPFELEEISSPAASNEVPA
jgi:hypothetical protein